MSKKSNAAKAVPVEELEKVLDIRAVPTLPDWCRAALAALEASR